MSCRWKIAWVRQISMCLLCLLACELPVSFTFVRYREFLFHLERISPVLMTMETDCAGYSNKAKLWGFFSSILHKLNLNTSPNPTTNYFHSVIKEHKGHQGSLKEFFGVPWQMRKSLILKWSPKKRFHCHTLRTKLLTVVELEYKIFKGHSELRVLLRPQWCVGVAFFWQLQWSAVSLDLHRNFSLFISVLIPVDRICWGNYFALSSHKWQFGVSHGLINWVHKGSSLKHHFCCDGYDAVW